MPVHDGSRSDPDERLPPPGPERFQPNPEQLVQGSHSTARSLRVQSQQLRTESQVFEDEVLPGTEGTDQPAEEMSERFGDAQPSCQNSPGAECLSSKSSDVHQSSRCTPDTTSKCLSRLNSGRPCWRHRAAIQRSFVGIGFPTFRNSTPIAA